MRIVIVGAGLGGLRAAESLRNAGYADEITVVGDDPRLPYHRPSVSKETITDGVEAPELPRKNVDDVTWRVGTRVQECDLAGHRLLLADDNPLEFDGLVIASGIRPRRLPTPGPARGRYVLRTPADAKELRDAIVPGEPVVIIGAGFIGCEVAAGARHLGADVTVVAMDSEPMLRPLGDEAAAAMRRRHEANGVRFLLGRTIDGFHGDGHVQSLSLDDGTELPTNVVVEAVGSVANVEWLERTGLDLSDGLLVDDAMQVATDLAPVVAVGDLARHRNALFGPIHRRVEHWNMPTLTGRRAGRTLADLVAGRDVDRSPFTGMPSFWSDQFGHQVQALGLPDIASRTQVVSGTLDGPCIIEYLDDTGLVGVVGIDRTEDVAAYRPRIGVHA